MTSSDRYPATGGGALRPAGAGPRRVPLTVHARAAKGGTR